MKLDQFSSQLFGPIRKRIEMTKSKARRQQKRRDAKTRAKPITDWLGFIRPPFARYRTLPWGKQKEFIEKLSQSTGSSANTLRRYIAAAELLESYGITVFPPNLKRMPVAAVEAIARISKKDPARGRKLLNSLMQGVGTIRDLKDELAEMPKGTSSRQHEAAAPVSQRELYAEIRELVGRAWPPDHPRLIKFSEWPGPATAFSKAAWPPFVFPLLDGRYVAIFDEAVLAWAVSPAMVTREFMRNVAAAVSMFDFVVVYCNALQPDVDRIVSAMRPDCRARVLARQGRLQM